jgi:hypothetical protein
MIAVDESRQLQVKEGIAMVIAAGKPTRKFEVCPHCGNKIISWDLVDKEPYCCICGWHHAVPISLEQARARLKWSSWLQVLSEDIGDN